MSDLTNLFREEMLASRANRLAGTVINRGGSSTWFAIAGCVALFSALLFWANVFTYATGRVVFGTVSEIRITAAAETISMAMPVNNLAWLHEGQELRMPSANGVFERAARVTSLQIVEGDHTASRAAGVRMPSNKLLISVRLRKNEGDQLITRGDSIAIKAVAERRSVLRWIIK